MVLLTSGLSWSRTLPEYGNNGIYVPYIVYCTVVRNLLKDNTFRALAYKLVLWHCNYVFIAWPFLLTNDPLARGQLVAVCGGRKGGGGGGTGQRPECVWIGLVLHMMTHIRICVAFGLMSFGLMSFCILSVYRCKLFHIYVQNAHFLSVHTTALTFKKML